MGDIMTYNFNGTPIHVGPGEVKYVATDSLGGSVSTLRPNAEKEIERGLWVEAYVYRISDDGVKLVSKPGEES